MTASAVIERFLAEVDRAGRDEAWIFRVPAVRLRAEARRIDSEVAAGAELPLAGRIFAVKDNIDVAGCPTTAGAPTFRYEPADDATAVARLRAAGAVVVGKTNLDQFATGLVGTRSPFGAVRHARDPERIAGGSSSGSAVVVALGLVDFALGTDTAGSGRVPAALHGLWGAKPTRGLVPATGVVPACRSLDCVTVLARDSRLAAQVAEVMSGPDGRDPLASRPDRRFRRQAGRATRLVVPARAELDDLAEGWAQAFDRVVDTAREAGIEIVERSIQPMLDAARMLYESSFVAERYAAVGDHIEAHAEEIGRDIDPTVARIISAGREFSAARLFDDLRTLEDHRVAAGAVLADADGVLSPTTTWHPTLEQVAADPVGANTSMGRYTNYANLLDMAAIAFPAGTVDGLPFGAMITGHAFSDDSLAALARSITDRLGDAGASIEAAGEVRRSSAADPEIDLFVVGAHRRGQALNHELVDRGGRYVGTRATAPVYRLHALDTQPPKPGLVRTRTGGVAVVGEVWRMTVSGFGDLVGAIPAPMAIGTVLLDGGESVKGFLCEPLALEAARDISSVGDWVRWIEMSPRH